MSRTVVRILLVVWYSYLGKDSPGGFKTLSIWENCLWASLHPSASKYFRGQVLSAPTSPTNLHLCHLEDGFQSKLLARNIRTPDKKRNNTAEMGKDDSVQSEESCFVFPGSLTILSSFKEIITMIHWDKVSNFSFYLSPIIGACHSHSRTSWESKWTIASSSLCQWEAGYH